MSRFLESITGIHPDEFQLAVALGRVPKVQAFSVWNENDAVDSTQEEFSNIASGIRTLPTSATVITIASTSAEDGAGTSTGALTVRVTFLDANYNTVTETVSLNGTSNVTTTKTAIRFTSAVVATAGSANAAVGNISFTINGNVQARILAGQAESRETGFTVPAGKVFYSSNAVIASGRAGAVDVDVAFEYRLFGSNVWITLRSLQIYQQVTAFDVISVAALPAKTDFRVLGTASGSGPACYVQVRGYLIDSDSELFRL